MLRNYPNKKYFVNQDDEFLNALNNEDGSISFGFSGKDYKFRVDKEKVIVENNKNEYSIVNKHITGKHNFLIFVLLLVLPKRLMNLTQGSISKLLKSSPLHQIALNG